MLTDTEYINRYNALESNLETSIKDLNDCILKSSNYTLRFYPEEITSGKLYVKGCS